MTSRSRQDAFQFRSLRNCFAFPGERKQSLRKLAVESLERREMMTVQYYGGGVMQNVDTQAVFYGSGWEYSPYYSQTGQLESFLSKTMGSSYMGMLNTAGYGVGAGMNTPGVILPYTNLSSRSWLYDSTIQSNLQTEVNVRALQNPTSNTLYVVYVAPGVPIYDNGSTSQSGFLGYHSAFVGRDQRGSTVDIHYAVIAYPGNGNFSATYDGFQTTLDQLTSVSSHEIAEAATDPNEPLGYYAWWDPSYKLGEIGDIAMKLSNYQPSSYDVVYNGFAVQKLINRNDQLIYPAGAQPYHGLPVGTGSPLGGMSNADGMPFSDPDDLGGPDGEGEDDDHNSTAPSNSNVSDHPQHEQFGATGDQPSGTSPVSSAVAATFYGYLLLSGGQMPGSASIDEVFRAIGAEPSKTTW